MKKTAYILLAALFVCTAVISAVLVDANPYWILLLIISVPGFFVSAVLAVCACSKDGDVPFVGY
ncbi:MULTISPECIES: hypothetical protein [Methanocorpusculum]|jgi:hypothetical protein|uniref:DUF788 domain-containing protein n=1 Tax=Methanocorpusculum parvum TaxID=2193 RepID=A0AAX0Q7S3_9EURY|nr:MULTISPECIES: hypothetical protein [Methanocorpusculum]MDD2248239.1 hypothetical protein [Methanocorpusculum sp.]MDD2802895.1 hypothetical protein [Methanocorpusculum sp.]MDD3046603.1 hypothetical protein [Methanocorpusculum sp.]MDD3912066.1 hypothetical protein [Methanocorpusculum sp.]MDD4423180.1 hypothetical protein [Methanocorpusculum parvum]